VNPSRKTNFGIKVDFAPAGESAILFQDRGNSTRERSGQPTHVGRAFE
jgi:hypothetical protein